MEFSSLN
nr:unknown [Medicago truncatula]